MLSLWRRVTSRSINRNLSPSPTSSQTRSIIVSPFRIGVFAAASILISASYSRHIFTAHSTSFVHRRFQSTFINLPTMASTLTPPQPPLEWKDQPAAVLDKTHDLIKKSRALQDTIAALDPKNCNFDTVFKELSLHEADVDNQSEPLSFYQNVSPDEKLRDASNDAEKLLRDFGIESSMRVDVYNSLKNAEKNIQESGQKLTPEQQRLVDKMILDGKRAGLDLPEDKRAELMQLKKQLSQTCLEFSKNYNEEKGTISLTIDELAGVPSDVISGFKSTQGTNGAPDTYSVTFKTPDIFPLFKYAQNPKTREKAMQAYEDRLSINVPLLKQAIDLRFKCARLLGYETWADYIEEPKMVKTAPNVHKFLDDLVEKLMPVGIKDRDALLEYKKAEHEERGYEYDGKFYIWDYRYYDTRFVEKTLSLDDAKVKEYFPVDVVVPTILKIYQDLLRVDFVEMKNPDVWHPEVQLFQVWNKGAKSETDFLGYTYLDLFPREAKYPHAAVWPIVQGYTKLDGTRNYPVTAMVANLAKPLPGKPATMRHDDVVTFFHEMGHVFHGLLSRTEFSRFHGTSVARDFVEAPSQMLENWCWEPQVLKKMSSHYETKEPLSDDLIHKLIQSRYVNAGLYFLRQLFFGKFDMHLHTEKTDDADYNALWGTMREKVSLVKSGTKETAGPGTFAHIAGGYDAGYYGYMYSLVFSADMYKAVFAENPLSPKSGRRYRESILQPGGSRDEMDSLKEFLGRDPDLNAFTDALFGTTASPKL
ncbi:hypothetical protein FRB94_007252 [Tulasnella sp. JGI-2019a]|nr:hypothetical protein FRB94_007252 [Tulasnella sp. JGI-2019a]